MYIKALEKLEINKGKIMMTRGGEIILYLIKNSRN